MLSLGGAMFIFSSAITLRTLVSFFSRVGFTSMSLSLQGKNSVRKYVTACYRCWSWKQQTSESGCLQASLHKRRLSLQE